MSAAIKIVPRETRLRVKARYNHETVEYAGNVFEFIQRLIDEQRAGIVTLRLASDGSFYSMEFDLRDRVVELAVDGKVRSMP